VSETVCVVGAGQMGSGIAQVAAVAGYDVTLVDVVARHRGDLGRIQTAGDPRIVQFALRYQF